MYNMKKEKNIDVGDLESELDGVAEVKAGAPKTRGGGGSITISPELASVLKRKCDDIDPTKETLNVPATWLDAKVGFDTDKSARGHPNTLKMKINRQYGDLAGDGKIWHIGNRENYKFYTFAIIDADEDEEKKWKKPPKKKEEEATD